MSRIAESELIINDRGAVYHIDLRPDELGDTVVTVGDPDRVREVSKYFDKIEVKRQHREFISHTGYIGKKRITVLSSGIGPDNIDIVMNELDALANIDLQTRTIKSEKNHSILCVSALPVPFRPIYPWMALYWQSMAWALTACCMPTKVKEFGNWRWKMHLLPIPSTIPAKQDPILCRGVSF